MENEIWKPVVGYEDYYEVSPTGRVRSLDRISETLSGVVKPTKGKVLNLTVKNNGYLSVMLSVKSITKRFHVHRLVAQAFIPNPYNKAFVNHKNGIKDDNRLENLEWCTRKENAQHASKTGLLRVGEDNAQSKLSKENVLAIRRLYKMNPNFNKTAISKKLGVQNSTIHKIINNKRWKHLL